VLTTARRVTTDEERVLRIRVRNTENNRSKITHLFVTNHHASMSDTGLEIELN